MTMSEYDNKKDGLEKNIRMKIKRVQNEEQIVEKCINASLVNLYRDKISVNDKHSRAGHNTQHLSIRSQLIK